MCPLTSPRTSGSMRVARAGETDVVSTEDLEVRAEVIRTRLRALRERQALVRLHSTQLREEGERARQRSAELVRQSQDSTRRRAAAPGPGEAAGEPSGE